jgi:hypothetical protein
VNKDFIPYSYSQASAMKFHSVGRDFHASEVIILSRIICTRPSRTNDKASQDASPDPRLLLAILLCSSEGFFPQINDAASLVRPLLQSLLGISQSKTSKFATDFNPGHKRRYSRDKTSFFEHQHIVLLS